MHCFFSLELILRKYSKRKSEERICYVKTDAFVQTILVHCKTRGDEWATAVQGWIEYFGGDLHAADCVYHSHVTSTSIQCVTFQDSSRQLNPPNNKKVEDEKTAIRMKHLKGCVYS